MIQSSAYCTVFTLLGKPKSKPFRPVCWESEDLKSQLRGQRAKLILDILALCLLTLGTAQKGDHYS